MLPEVHLHVAASISDYMHSTGSQKLHENQLACKIARFQSAKMLAAYCKQGLSLAPIADQYLTGCAVLTFGKASDAKLRDSAQAYQGMQKSINHHACRGYQPQKDISVNSQLKDLTMKSR